MVNRTITGLILIAVFVGFMAGTYFVSPIFADIIIFLFLAGSVFEMYKCLKGAGYKIIGFPVCFVTVLSYPVFYLMQYFLGERNTASIGLQGLLIVLLIGVMIALTTFTFRPTKTKRPQIIDTSSATEYIAESPKNALELKDLFATIFVLIYPVTFMAVSWTLSYKYCAFFSILYAVFIPIVGSDMFAYFVGASYSAICRKKGKEPKRLCPTVSPKKTVAGGIGGLLGGILLSMIFWLGFEYFSVFDASGYTHFISHETNGWIWQTALIYVAIGTICGVISELGDLAASKIKRAIGVKDYGKIFPGHGGFMDRIDSTMYCLVILLIAFTVIYGY